MKWSRLTSFLLLASSVLVFKLSLFRYCLIAISSFSFWWSLSFLFSLSISISLSISLSFCIFRFICSFDIFFSTIIASSSISFSFRRRIRAMNCSLDIFVIEDNTFKLKKFSSSEDLEDLLTSSDNSSHLENDLEFVQSRNLASIIKNQHELLN